MIKSIEGLHYPDQAGYMEPTTSKEAADKINKSGRSATLRESLLDMFEHGFIGSAYAAAHAMGKPFHSVQPRCSELLAQGKILRAGKVMGPYGTRVWEMTIAIKQTEMKL